MISMTQSPERHAGRACNIAYVRYGDAIRINRLMPNAPNKPKNLLRLGIPHTNLIESKFHA